MFVLLFARNGLDFFSLLQWTTADNYIFSSSLFTGALNHIVQLEGASTCWSLHSTHTMGGPWVTSPLTVVFQAMSHAAAPDGFYFNPS